jgi:hypothetical protein
VAQALCQLANTQPAGIGREHRGRTVLRGSEDGPFEFDALRDGFDDEIEPLWQLLDRTDQADSPGERGRGGGVQLAFLLSAPRLCGEGRPCSIRLLGVRLGQGVS